MDRFLCGIGEKDGKNCFFTNISTILLDNENSLLIYESLILNNKIFCKIFNIQTYRIKEIFYLSFLTIPVLYFIVNPNKVPRENPNLALSLA